MKSQTVLISIFIFSFFALHQCMQMDVGEIEGSNKISIGKCVPAQCSVSFFKRDCWCCFRDQSMCSKTQKECESNPRCPPFKVLNFLKINVLL
ncbi:unnamed protein product [Arabidopsis thaliana]|uniref:Embryo surrounding factor 1 brassicaceae domain-containing protein n=1 Tax=Arabidopsis thaliana TaxID=3702 RepID=A0A654E8R1_ARATH|nr:unnamed protein product [Arabidopsis thaliana]